MQDTTSFIERDGMISDKDTMAGQTTGDWIDREVVGGFIRDNDTQAGTAVGEGISLATETIVDNGVEGLSNGYDEGITGVEDVIKNDAFNVGG
jgi:hypothetical protein